MDSAYLKREVASLEGRLEAALQARDSAHADASDAKSRHTSICSSLLQVLRPHAPADARLSWICIHSCVAFPSRQVGTDVHVRMCGQSAAVCATAYQL